ncbi:hypothetical protein [Nitrososphaera sp.]|uniref:hypothetical protein n=1 Tax=Nitrososphaera sp. TaxID=1971748 RepID=UPI00307CE806
MPKAESPDSKTITTSFRIKSDLLKKLQQEADEKELNLTSLANQIFAGHVKWGSMATKAGFMPVSKELMRLLLSRLDRDEVVQVAKELRDNIKSAHILMHGRYTVETFLDTLGTLSKESDFAFMNQAMAGRRQVAIQHSLGHNFSVLVAEICAQALSELGRKGIEREVTDSMMLVAFDDF